VPLEPTIDAPAGPHKVDTLPIYFVALSLISGVRNARKGARSSILGDPTRPFFARRAAESEKTAGRQEKHRQSDVSLKIPNT